MPYKVIIPNSIREILIYLIENETDGLTDDYDMDYDDAWKKYFNFVLAELILKYYD